MLLLLAQTHGSPPVQPEIAAPSLLDLLFGSCFGVFWLAAMGFWAWMLIECLRKDPDRYIWLWVIIFVWPIGALIYFFLRWIPSRQIRAPQALRKWTRGKELARLATAARQIGNPHQWIQYGDALRDMGRFDEAGDAYERALHKEADNLQALWGAALVDIQHDEFEAASDRLQQILKIDPQYKFGDVSLEYGKALCELNAHEAAIEHFETHIRRWPQPEALYVLSRLHVEQGNVRQARQHLESMLMDIDSSPRGIARRFAVWKSRGKRLLRKLPRA